MDRGASPHILHILTICTVPALNVCALHLAPQLLWPSPFSHQTWSWPPNPRKNFGSPFWFSSVSIQSLADFLIPRWVKSSRAWPASLQSLSLLPQMSWLFSSSNSCILARALTFYHYLYFSKLHLPWAFQTFKSPFPSLSAHHISVCFFSIS